MSKYLWKLIELPCSQTWRKVISTWRKPGENLEKKNPNSVRTMYMVPASLWHQEVYDTSKYMVPVNIWYQQV